MNFARLGGFHMQDSGNIFNDIVISILYETSPKIKLYNRFAILANVRLRLTQKKEIPILSS